MWNITLIWNTSSFDNSSENIKLSFPTNFYDLDFSEAAFVVVFKLWLVIGFLR